MKLRIGDCEGWWTVAWLFWQFVFIALLAAFTPAICQEVTEPPQRIQGPAIASNPDSEHAFVLDILRDLPGSGDEVVDRWRIELLAPVSSRVSLAAGFQHEDRRLFIPLRPDIKTRSWGLTLRARIYIGG